MIDIYVKNLVNYCQWYIIQGKDMIYSVYSSTFYISLSKSTTKPAPLCSDKKNKTPNEKQILNAFFKNSGGKNTKQTNENP